MLTSTYRHFKSGTELEEEMISSMISLIREDMARFTNEAKLKETCAELSVSEMISTVILSKDGALVAFASYKRNVTEKLTRQTEKVTDYLHAIHVAATMRKKGLGSALMALVEASAERQGSQNVMLTVHKKNKRSLHFYKLKGFKLTVHSPKLASYVILEKTCRCVHTHTSAADASAADASAADASAADAAGTANSGSTTDGGSANAGAPTTGKAYSAATKKARTTSVWLLESPVNHFIYRFVIYFAPQSQKDWASGHRFIEHVLANEELTEEETWVFEGLLAIRGSRNGVFYADAIAIVLWLKRAQAFLERQEELAKARGDRVGGATRRYLLGMAKQPAVVAMLHAMALCYLELYLPFMSAITHVADVAEDLPKLDQAVYKALEDVNPGDLLDNADVDGESLLPPEYDRIKQSTRDKRDGIVRHIRELDSDVRDLTLSILSAMLQAGAGMFYRHTIERQVEEHDPTAPDQRLGSATNLSEQRKDKIRPAAVTNHDAERMNAVLKMVRQRAPTLMDSLLFGRVRNHIDNPAEWLMGLAANDSFSMDEICSLVRIAGAPSPSTTRPTLKHAFSVHASSQYARVHASSQHMCVHASSVYVCMCI